MRRIGLVLFLLVAATSASAQLKLPALVGDHMVLQQGKPLPIWGWSAAGEEVTVTLGDQSATTVAGEDGRWRLNLEPMEAGGPYDITVRTATQSIEIADVMIGEVWLCSGQSNMDMRLAKLWDSERLESDLERDGIRLFRVERAIADEPADDLDGAWSLCEPKVAAKFSAVAYFFGVELQRELGVTVGLIHSAYGGTPAEAWTDTQRILSNPALTSIADSWQRREQQYAEKLEAWESNGEAQPDSTKPSEPPQRYKPGGLFNAMIEPMIPYAIRGACWYQGESNIWHATQYQPLLTALIEDWRDRWSDSSLPFAVVQLPNYANPPRVPEGPYSWAELRESQRLVSKNLPAVGLITTIDIGEPTDVHPRNKVDVGHRLALWALAEVYGGDSVYSGPRFAGYAIEGDKVRISFDHVGSGLAARDSNEIKGFVIAGPDQKFRWATAEIDGDDLLISEAKVPDPRSVRYGWADDPHWANLINREGLPASPFRTDDWEPVTHED